MFVGLPHILALSRVLKETDDLTGICLRQEFARSVLDGNVKSRVSLVRENLSLSTLLPAAARVSGQSI